MQKTVTILGSTGTIGQNTLKCIELHPDRFAVHALVGGGNAGLLARQARQFRAKLAVISRPDLYKELKESLQGAAIEVAAGEEAVIEAASSSVDITMSAIVGSAGLKPTLAAIKNGKTIALANKESLVCAGELVKKEVEKYGAKIIPVDSEHNALFQLINNQDIKHIERVVITASGGPFRSFSLEQMKNVTPEQAIRHPNWNMGAKISVDSATMMNKGLELIEACRLFDIAHDKVDIVVHPQSVVHSMVEYVDGSTLAQLGCPDMRTPIAYGLAWPERIAAGVQRLNFASAMQLGFLPPDEVRFPALRLAREALQAEGSAPVVLNAANEVAVAAFLAGKLSFTGIVDVVERVLRTLANLPAAPDIAALIAVDKKARAQAEHEVASYG